MKRKIFKILAAIAALLIISAIIMWFMVKDEIALMKAVVYRDREAIEYYIDEKGIDPNKNFYEINLIDFCMRSYSGEVDLDFVQFLLDKGVDTRSHSDIRLSPLMVAILHNEKELAELLIKNGADVNEKAYGEYKPLALAVILSSLKHEDGSELDKEVFSSRCEMVKLLTKHGATLDGDKNEEKRREHLGNCYK